MKLKLRTLKDPPPPPMEWLVEDVIPARDLTTMAGEPASGKSALAADLAVAIATGGEWLGTPLEKGGVLWIAAEAADSSERRIRSMTAGDTDAPIVFAGGDINLVDDNAAEEAIEAAHEVRFSTGHRVRLIVVDALSSATRGADENSGRDMGPAMGALLKVVAGTGAAVLLLAHVGKGGGDGSIRGHSGLLADAGAHLYLCKAGKSRKSGSTLTLEVLKLRDGEAGTRINFALVFDGDGVRVEVAEKRGAEAPAPQLPEDVLVALDVLRQAGGTLDFKTWRTKVFDGYGNRSAGAKRTAFSKAKGILERGRIRIDGNIVSISEVSASVSATGAANGRSVSESVSAGGSLKTPADAADTPQPEAEEELDEFGDPIPSSNDLRQSRPITPSPEGRRKRPLH